MTAAQNQSRRALTDIVAPRIFATTIMIPDDMQDRIARRMKRAVPADLAPKRFRPLQDGRPVGGRAGGHHAERDRRIAEMAGLGMTNHQIAAELGMTRDRVSKIIRASREAAA